MPPQAESPEARLYEERGIRSFAHRVIPSLVGHCSGNHLMTGFAIGGCGSLRFVIGVLLRVVAACLLAAAES
jgi:hypothetical protein